jgi:hypothetical protein
MDSHEYAEKLREASEVLKSRPAFEINSVPFTHMYFSFEKDKFISAVKALGSGKKEVDQYYVTFKPSSIPVIQLYIDRNSVCRKVQEEKWDCEPLLSELEDAQVGA